MRLVSAAMLSVFWALAVSALMLVAAALASAETSLLLGSFNEVDADRETLLAEWSVYYEADTGELSGGEVAWHVFPNYGLCGLDAKAEGWVDPVTQEFDVTLDITGGWVGTCLADYDRWYTPNGTLRLINTFEVQHGTWESGGSIIRDFEATFDWLYFDALSMSGDADMDGYFDSSDLVRVFERGNYESTNENMTLQAWDRGDFNRDWHTTSEDLVLSFMTGTYEQDVVASVPEASAVALLLIGAVLSCLAPRMRAGG